NGRLVRDGYLVQVQTIAELANRLDIPPDALAATIEQHNHAAATGNDPLFQKGDSSHNRALGDLRIGPNPCLGPIKDGPFYAIGLYSGDLGTARGLLT